MICESASARVVTDRIAIKSEEDEIAICEVGNSLGIQIYEKGDCRFVYVKDIVDGNPPEGEVS